MYVVDFNKLSCNTDSNYIEGKWKIDDQRSLKMLVKKVECILHIYVIQNKNYLDIYYTDITKFDVSKLYIENVYTESKYKYGCGTELIRRSKKIKWNRIDSNISKVRFYFKNNGKRTKFNLNIGINENDLFEDIMHNIVSHVENTDYTKLCNYSKSYIEEFYGNIALHGLNKYTLEEVILNRLEENEK